MKQHDSINQDKIMTAYISARNIYSSLNEDEQDSGTSSPIRKAQKKLREIEKLKLKMNKTPEEYKKIREESIWRAIVEPVYSGTSESVEDVEKRKIKQKEKRQMKEFERKQRLEKEKHKKELEAIKQDYQEKMRLLEEEKRQMKLEHYTLQTENQELKLMIQELLHEKYSSSSSSSSSPTSSIFHDENPVSTEEKIEEEFLEVYAQEGSYKKTYKKMMLQYHPDKCPSKRFAGEVSAILNRLKEKYKD